MTSTSLLNQPEFQEKAATYLRVASLSIASYDWLLTLPTEWKFYKSQQSLRRPSLACVLFFLIRYISILVLVISNVGFFHHGFSVGACHRYYMAAPATKLLQTLISQIILGIRTFNIARRTAWVGWTMLTILVLFTIAEWVLNLLNREPNPRTPKDTFGNCFPVNPQTASGLKGASSNSAWAFYALSMIYDLITLSIATLFLVRYSPTTIRMSGLVKAMIYDGLGYFVWLTLANIINIILYRTNTSAVQSAGASLGYTVIWIMSQRILISLRKLSDNVNRLEETRPINSREAAHALRSQFGSKGNHLDGEFDTRRPEAGLEPTDVELEVQVHLERNIRIERSPDEMSSYETKNRGSPT